MLADCHLVLLRKGFCHGGMQHLFFLRITDLLGLRVSTSLRESNYSGRTAAKFSTDQWLSQELSNR